MKHFSLNCLIRPLLGAALVCVLSSVACSDALQAGGSGCTDGGGGAQHAASPPMNGCASRGPDRSCGPVASDDAMLFKEEFLPPGTLGRTYVLPSRPVPADRHPRVAMIDVCAPAAAHVIVRWTNDFRTEESLKGYQDEFNPSVWHFESKPLVPGLRLIYRVEVYHDGPGSPPTTVRYVRLIKGRVVYLRV